MKKPALSRSQKKTLRTSMKSGGFSHQQVQDQFAAAGPHGLVDLYRRFVGPLPTDPGGVLPVRGKAKKPAMVPYSILLPENLLSDYRTYAEMKTLHLSQVVRHTLKQHNPLNKDDETT
jgi:hypothetical protein